MLNVSGSHHLVEGGPVSPTLAAARPTRASAGLWMGGSRQGWDAGGAHSMDVRAKGSRLPSWAGYSPLSQVSQLGDGRTTKVLDLSGAMDLADQLYQFLQG